METLSIPCPECRYMVPTWAIEFADRFVNDEEVVREVREMFARTDESDYHALIHTPEDY